MEPQDKATDHQKTKHQLFNGDGFRLLLLTMLYSVQGFAFGFIDITMPVILKKHFNYSEVGVITWCCIPFSIKFIFAPFVDTYFLKWVGKRRSWILPTQLLLVAINLYAASNITQLIDSKSYGTITLVFSVVILFCALQDIAVDSWWLTLVKQENRDNASLTQTIGIQLGVFVSTTLYYALNSLHFWNQYLYAAPGSEPLVDESKFFLCWGYFTLAVFVVTLVFGNEKHDRIQVEEHGMTVKEVMNTIKWSLKSKQILYFILFSFALRLFSCVNLFVGKIYLLDEIKYSQSKYSFISLLCFPVTILSTMFIVKFGKGFKILHKLVMICIFRAIMDILTINVLYASFSFGADFDILVFISNWSDVFSYVSWHSMMISYSNTVTNPIIAATQVTFIHSITNFGDAFPKFYTFWLIDIFGVFTPNFVGCILSLAICFGLYNKSKDPDLYKIMEVPGLKQKIE